MELNFNSVEMSSKPNAEASSLDYAEALLKELLIEWWAGNTTTKMPIDKVF